jgi:integrase
VSTPSKPPRRVRGDGSLRLVNKPGRTPIWYARWYHRGRRVEQSTGFGETDRTKALKFLRAKLKDAGTPRYVAPQAERLRFEALCDLIRRDYERKGNRSAIQYKLDHLADHFGGWAALAISTEAVEKYTDARMEAGAAVATVNRELAALRRMFRLAVKTGRLPSMPTIELRPENNARQGFLDPPDLEVALAALRGCEPVIADVTEAAFFTCLRRGNVLALTWPMVRPEEDGAGQLVGGELRVPGSMTKNKRELVLPLSGRLLDVFARRWTERSLKTPHVFHRHGKPVVRFDAAWEAARKATGRPDLKFHDLRRSGARTMRRKKVDQLTIMARGGWKTPSMFARYAITDEQDQIEAQAALDEALASAGPSKVTPLRRRPGRSKQP